MNTTHATLFLANVGLFSVNGKFGGDKDKPAPNWEEDGMWGPPMHSAATRIYETKDGRYFQLHGDLNASFLLKDIGLEDKRDISLEEAQQIVANWVKQYTADELEKMMVEQKHSGSKCYKPEEWLATDMGKALAARPLCDVRQLTPPTNEPVPYLSPSNAKRILEGIKVVEMGKCYLKEREKWFPFLTIYSSPSYCWSYYWQDVGRTRCSGYQGESTAFA